MPRFSAEDVRRSYTPEKAWAEFSGDVFVRFVHRPLSFPVATLLLRLGLPTHAVTVTSALVALSLPAMATRPAGALVVGVGAFAVQLLDCVDGNMARTRGEASAFGAVLDGVVDVVYAVALYAALGRLAASSGGLGFAEALTLAAVTAVATLVGRVSRDLGAKVTGTRVEHTPNRPTTLSASSVVLIAFGSLEQTYPTLLAIAGLTDSAATMTPWLLRFAAGYACVVLAVSIVLALLAARRADTSRHQVG